MIQPIVSIFALRNIKQYMHIRDIGNFLIADVAVWFQVFQFKK